MENEESKEIFEAYQQVKNLQQSTVGFDLALAKQLSYLKAKKRYKTILGYPEASWKTFLAQPELKITYSKSQRLVAIYDIYIVQLGLQPEEIMGVDTNSLYRMKGVVNKENVKEWLEKAKELSRLDLTRELKFGHVDEMTCNHDFECKEMCVCKICGTRQIKLK